jgi:cytochrome c biogenesis factor
MTVAGYTLTNHGVGVTRTPAVTRTFANLAVTGRFNGTIRPAQADYAIPPEPAQEVSIKTDWLRGEDLYVIADELHPTTGLVYVKVLVKPLVNLIWVAGFVFLLGSAVALWPDAREQRRLVARLVPA